MDVLVSEYAFGLASPAGTIKNQNFYYHHDIYILKKTLSNGN